MIVLSESATEQVKNDLFERINRGSDLLRNMEKRKGIYRGEFNKFIYNKCAKHPLMSKLAPLAKAVENRQEHEELILRFFALIDSYPKFSTHYRGIGVMLDEYLDEMNQKSTPELLKEKESQFNQMLEKVDEIFINGFAKRPGQGVSRIFFEAISVGTYLALKSLKPGKTPRLDAGAWLRDQKFNSIVSGKYKTHTPDKIKQRIDYVTGKILNG